MQRERHSVQDMINAVVLNPRVPCHHLLIGSEERDVFDVHPTQFIERSPRDLITKYFTDCNNLNNILTKYYVNNVTVILCK